MKVSYGVSFVHSYKCPIFALSLDPGSTAATLKDIGKYTTYIYKKTDYITTKK